MMVVGLGCRRVYKGRGGDKAGGWGWRMWRWGGQGGWWRYNIRVVQGFAVFSIKVGAAPVAVDFGVKNTYKWGYENLLNRQNRRLRLQHFLQSLLMITPDCYTNLHCLWRRGDIGPTSEEYSGPWLSYSLSLSSSLIPLYPLPIPLATDPIGRSPLTLPSLQTRTRRPPGDTLGWPNQSPPRPPTPRPPRPLTYTHILSGMLDALGGKTRPS